MTVISGVPAAALQRGLYVSSKPLFTDLVVIVILTSFVVGSTLTGYTGIGSKAGNSSISPKMLDFFFQITSMLLP